MLSIARLPLSLQTRLLHPFTNLAPKTDGFEAIKKRLRRAANRSPSEVETDFPCQRSRRQVMRAAERRQKVVKRVRVRDIDRGELQAHFVFVALENIVIANRQVEHVPRCNSWRIFIVILRSRCGDL